MAMEAGVSALGLVSHMPSGPGVIEEALIAEIAQLAPPHIETYLLTSHQHAPLILAQHARCQTTTLQLVDEVSVSDLQQLRQQLPHVHLVQVIHVTGPDAIAQAQAVAPWVDRILLDSGNPGLPVKQLGGTGRVHDWLISRGVRDAVEVPVLLAGGLSPENVSQAIGEVRPWGLDVCSGVRTGDQLDPDKLARFVAAVRAESC